MEDDEAGWNRRNTRAALAEIPMRLGQLRVSPLPWAPMTAIPTPPSPATPRYALTPNTRDNTPPSLPSSANISPTLPPDELVIQQRGRKRMPVVWSPDIDRKSPFIPSSRTPPKSANTNSSRNGIVLRSSPKKRVLLAEFDTITSARRSDGPDFSTPTKLRNQSPTKIPSTPKKMKLCLNDNTNPLDVVLKGMSHEQLVDIIKNVVQKHPNLEQEVRDELSLPDLKPFEEKLVYLKRNIFRSLPSSRLTSKTDSPAFARAATHLIAFKKQLVEQGRVLVESQHWKSVLEYSALSWNYVKATPLWDNPPHNTVRRQSFKYLVGLCMNALKKGQFEKSFLKHIRGLMENMASDSDDIQFCIKLIDSQLK